MATNIENLYYFFDIYSLFSLFSEVILALKNLRAFDNHICQGAIILIRLHKRDLFYDIEALYYLSKDRHRTIQMGHATDSLVDFPTVGRNYLGPHRR